MEQDLNKKISQATKWSSLAQLAAKLMAPITNAILARLLMPEAFGVVATLTLVVSFAEIFTDAGFQKYLVQHQFKDDDDLNIGTNVAFWTNLALSLVLWAIIALFATPITNMVGSPGCEAAVITMCAQIPLLAFSSIQMARYRREFDFKTLFYVRLVTAFIPLIITVPLAIAFKSYWALVFGTLTRDIVKAFILTFKSSWKPRFCFSMEKLKDMFSFSIWTVVENISIWLTSNVGTFVVGTMLNSYYSGLYKTTVTTVNAYMVLITAATTPVMFSALSRAQDDTKTYNSIFFRFVRMVSILVFPMGAGLFVYRKLATYILLGSKWMEAADFLGMWSLASALLIVFSHYNSEVFRSKGKPKLSVLTQVLHLIVLIPVLLYFANQGFQALTIARCVVRLQLALVSTVLLQLAIGIKATEIFRNVWPQIIASVVMTAAGMGMLMISENIIFQFASILVCVVVYFGTLMLIPAGKKELLEIPLARKILRRLKIVK